MRFVIGLILGIVVGGAAAWFALPGGEGRLGSFPEEALRPALLSAAEPMINDRCYPEEWAPPGGWKVADFFADLTAFQSTPSADKSLGGSCGFRGDNLCTLTYSLANVEEDKGQSWNLGYSVDPATGAPVPGSFECFGL